MLAFDSVGHGPDPFVVLVHGWPLDRSIWQSVAGRVARAGYRVLCPDLSDFGESPPPEVPRSSVEGLACALAGFMETLGLHRFAIAGHSFGGYVALALAEGRPDLVAGLGLISSRTTADSDTVRQGRRETIEKVRAAGSKALLPGLAEKLVGPRGAAMWVPQAARIIERARPSGVIAGLAAMATRPDRTSIFDSFPGPRLVVHGTADALVPIAEAPQPSKGPTAVRTILPQVGHMPMWEAPVATSDAIIAWAKLLRG